MVLGEIPDGGEFTMVLGEIPDGGEFVTVLREIPDRGELATVPREAPDRDELTAMPSVAHRINLVSAALAGIGVVTCAGVAEFAESDGVSW